MTNPSSWDAEAEDCQKLEVSFGLHSEFQSELLSQKQEMWLCSVDRVTAYPAGNSGLILQCCINGSWLHTQEDQKFSVTLGYVMS